MIINVLHNTPNCSIKKSGEYALIPLNTVRHVQFLFFLYKNIYFGKFFRWWCMSPNITPPPLSASHWLSHALHGASPNAITPPFQK